MAFFNNIIVTRDGYEPINSIKADDKWHIVGTAGEPAFEWSWKNYAYSYCLAGFRKDAFGIVHLQGLVYGGSVGSSLAVFTLPPGYRPYANQYYASGGDIWLGIANGAVADARVDIYGRVSLQSGNSNWYSLNNFYFPADGF